MNNNRLLIEKFENRSALIGVIGLGYVGLPLALRYAEAGYQVLGFDIDSAKSKQIAAGQSYFRHISSERFDRVKDRLQATTNFSRVDNMDALIICVPTPLGAHREPDISFVTNTMETIMPFLRAGQVISLESTTYPGTTEEELRPRIEKAGLVIGRDCFLVYSPEREDPGNKHFSTQTIPKVVSGSSEECLEVGIALYRGVIDELVPVSSTKVAEMSKLLENIHRAVNIGLVNEMKILADKMDIDIHEVISAASTKPFGFVPYFPGPGLGGHCIPIDPYYLTWKAREYGINTRFIELAGEINSYMPTWVVSKITSALNTHSKSIRGSRILILGIAYKKNVDDVRESPAVEIMQQLRDLGAEIQYSDPYIPNFPIMRNYSFNLSSAPLSDDLLADSDCVVIVTDHDSFDFERISEKAHLIVDTRGRLRTSKPNLVKA